MHFECIILLNNYIIILIIMSLQQLHVGDGGGNCEVGRKRGNRERGSGGTTASGYGGCYSNNGDNSTTVNADVHDHASSTVRNYGSFNACSYSLQPTAATCEYVLVRHQ